MKVEMLMPQMGESITEATVSKWLKSVGDTVKKDEIILEISTDKVDSEIPAPESGVLQQIVASEGDVVPVKTVIAVIDTEGSAAAAPSSVAPAASTPSPQPTPQPSAVQPSAESSGVTSDRFYSPLVKSLAEKHGISLSELDAIPGSGQAGRFTKQDFMAYLDNRGQSAPASQNVPTSNAPAQQAPVPSTTERQVEAKNDMPDGHRDDGSTIVPMDGMRKAIAEHMVRSKQTSPHVYSIQEVDVTNIAKWRAQHKAEFKKKEGFNLSFTPFFLEAAVKGLLEYPYVNASVEGHSIILKKNVNLGCAVALGTSGLIVPVIKSAEERNLVGIARALNDLASRARNKKLMPDDVMGGTFTVTNPGVFGTIIGTPIINQPQVAILCLGAIEKRPVVIDDMIAIRQRCYLTLSYDHRIVDGSTGGMFLRYVCDYLENWDMDRSLF